MPVRLAGLCRAARACRPRRRVPRRRVATCGSARPARPTFRNEQPGRGPNARCRSPVHHPLAAPLQLRLPGRRPGPVSDRPRPRRRPDRALLALTLVGDAAISLWLTTHADRLGRRRVLVAGALLVLAAGLVVVATPVTSCWSSPQQSGSSAPPATRLVHSWRSNRPRCRSCCRQRAAPGRSRGTNCRFPDRRRNAGGRTDSPAGAPRWRKRGGCLPARHHWLRAGRGAACAAVPARLTRR